jgi:hypothetical protein
MSTEIITKSPVELKADLDRLNSEAAALALRDVRRGTGPSAEYVAAYRAAKHAYRAYWDAMDAKMGVAPWPRYWWSIAAERAASGGAS